MDSELLNYNVCKGILLSPHLHSDGNGAGFIDTLYIVRCSGDCQFFDTSIKMA